jgi:hypothetical protein
MAFIGTPLDTRNTFQSLQGKRFDGDGSTTAFTLDVAPSSTLDIEVFVGNVRQDPNSAYTLSGTTLTFTGAPPSGTNNIYVVHQAKSVGTIDPPATETIAKTFSSTVQLGGTADMNGTEFILDADADTSITADTDDQIDIKIAGADDFQFTANTFTAQSGSTITTPTLGVGTTRDQGVLHVRTADSGATAGTDSDELVLENSAAGGMTILSPTDANGKIAFGDSGDADIGAIIYEHDGNNLRFHANGSERMRIDSSGNLLQAKTSANSNNAGIELRPAGELTITRTNNQLLDINRTDDDGTLVVFRQANSTEGTIGVSGGTVSYNTFMGAHWSRLADNSKPTILRGSVMETIATMCDWYQVDYTNKDGKSITEYIGALPDGKSVGDNHTVTVADIEYTGKISKEKNYHLPMCKISDTEDSKAVYGVFHCWDNDDNKVNDMNIASLGTYVVRIHKDETVAIGDYLQSKGDGTAKKQADDILRASTIAKVTSTTKTITHADGSYCVPCTLHCG